jgi:stearoyl-CoA desaturase (delta-9 desaturase)
LHPAASHFFRFWLWLTTGMVTKEWAAVHRKHHAKCDTPEDPHSPQVLGIHRVLWGGVFLYVKEARRPETLARYGHGTPDDWLERKVYSRHASLGLVLMGFVDVALFGPVPGLLIVLTQIVWIPFWAAGVVNGIGHYWGWRHWSTPDASTNIFPIGILIGGEELHNNHHAYPTSAKLSCKWYELDIGWGYIRALQALRLAEVKHVMPTPHLAAPKPAVDPQTLQAVIACRYDVLARYARSVERIYAEEMAKLRRAAPEAARTLMTLQPKLLARDEKMLREADRVRIAAALPQSRALQTMVAMRRELIAVWGRSTATREQLVRQLQDWCQRAEASGIRALAEFSLLLRRYA